MRWNAGDVRVSGALDRAEVDCFRYLFAERLGLFFEDGKLDFLGDVLSANGKYGKRALLLV